MPDKPENHPSQPHAELPALAQAATAPWALRLAHRQGTVLLVLLILLAFTPWQQNVRGMGRVVAYAPVERQQVVGAPVDGRVSRWLVREGSRVQQGEVLAELADNDPLLLQRLEAERQTLLARQAATDARVETFREQLRMAESARPQALAAAEARLGMAEERRKAAEQALQAAQAAQRTAALNLERQAALHGEGLASRRTLELAQLDMAQRRTEAERGQAALRAASAEVAALAADRRKLEADTTAAVEKSRAEWNKALEDQNYVRADLLKLETRVARQQTQQVTAPRAGTVLRLAVAPGAEMVKAGQPLGVLVPDTQERAVELWLDGNDIPLVVAGSKVRLQFEGYPAVQFGGWPELSIGSFGGQVALIDATDDGKGHFRLLVTPDPDDVPWPSERFLRQGVRTNGWVLLGQVTLGYELWRIFNGFPPLVLPEPAALSQPAKGDSAKSDGEGKDK
jgi:multidrug efflux pump subunit AcrA (membrane-fusion protein)